jgi:hypothetical protein
MAKEILIGLLFTYCIFLLILSALFTIVGDNFICKNRIRADYIFPARPIACFLKTPVKVGEDEE